MIYCCKNPSAALRQYNNASVTPIFAIAARSILPNNPSDIIVAISPTLSGPMIVITALATANSNASNTKTTLDFIYAALLPIAAPTLFLLFFSVIFVSLLSSRFRRA